MNKILVPTDFSENASNALEYALELARLSDAGVMLQHSYKVNSDPPLSDESYTMAHDRVRTQLELLRDEIKTEPKYMDITIEIHPAVGNVVDGIDELTGRYNIDLVVMGTRGASGAKEIFIGSNAANAIHNSQCPVLAVPENAKLDKIDSIVFATDLHEIDNDEALEVLKAIAKLCNAEIRMLNIRTEESHLSGEEALESAREVHYFGEEVPHTQEFMSGYDVLEEINNYVNDNADEVNMICMVARRYTLWERIFHSSKTEQMAFHTKIPLLALHD